MQPTMSHSALLLSCQRWAADDMPKRNDGVNPEALHGTAFHKAMEQKLRYGGYLIDPVDATDPPLIAARVDQAHAVLIDWLQANGWMEGAEFYCYEQSLGWRVDDVWSEGDTIPLHPPYFVAESPNEEHIYPYDKRFFCGTGDLFVIPIVPGHGLCRCSDCIAIKKKPILILDYKTGEQEDYSDPSKLHQLWSLAAVATKVYGHSSAHLAVLHAPMSGGAPQVYCTSKPISPKRLRVYRNMVRRAWKRIGDGSLTPGDHCESLYCPAYTSCPMRNVALTTLRRTTPEMALTTPEEVARIWKGGHEMIKVWEGRLLKELRAYVEAHGDVPLGQGKKLTIVPNKPQTTLSFASIEEALKEAKQARDAKRVAGIVKLLADVNRLGVTKTFEKKASLTTRKDGDGR